jgi:predicted aconitase with swiveling domain
MQYSGRIIFSGQVTGIALVSPQAISFFGGVDPDSGIIVERGHPLEGECIAGKVLVFPTGKGSTVGSYTLYRLKHNHLAPAAILNLECEPITAVGCIIAEIPCVDQLPIDIFNSGDLVEIDGECVTINSSPNTSHLGEHRP